MTDTLPVLNYDLFEETIAWAYHSAHADKKQAVSWNQDTWTSTHENKCRTSFCLAGYVNYVTDNVMFVPAGTPYTVISALTRRPVMTQTRTGDFCPLDENGKPDCRDDSNLWAVHAMKVLGLTESEAEDLFDGTNDLEDVMEIAERITEIRDLPPVDVHKFRLISRPKKTDPETIEITPTTERHLVVA